jgi:NADH-quinone oxidoreductase subunit A
MTVQTSGGIDQKSFGRQKLGCYTGNDAHRKARESPMLSSFGPIALFFVVAAIFPIVPLLLNRFVAPHRPDRVKLSPYESGVETIGPTHVQFRTRFYLYALIFVIFDVEAIYLFPWAVAFNQLGLFALIEMALFIGFLLVAFAYAWRKRALEWV